MGGEFTPVLVLAIGASSLAFLALSGSHSRSRAGWSLLFAYGVLATFVGALLVFTFHFHAITLGAVVLHLHGAAESIEAASTTAASAVVIGTTAVVFGLAFALNQLSFRRMAARARREADPGETARLRSLCPGDETLWVVESREPAGFCFAVLGRRAGRALPGAREYLILTTALTGAMDDAMLRATVAHERAHVSARDSRYLPVARAARRLMFFDPVYRWIERRFEEEREFAADRRAVQRTGDPRALARALLAALEVGVEPRAKSCGLVGTCGPAVVVRRIEALLAMAEAQGGPPP
ncbi:MAG TPA: M56 family metallopeptidase [Candidatus Thermoplasmatota archaeon]